MIGTGNREGCGRAPFTLLLDALDALACLSLSLLFRTVDRRGQSFHWRPHVACCGVCVCAEGEVTKQRKKTGLVAMAQVCISPSKWTVTGGDYGMTPLYRWSDWTWRTSFVGRGMDKVTPSWTGVGLSNRTFNFTEKLKRFIQRGKMGKKKTLIRIRGLDSWMWRSYQKGHRGTWNRLRNKEMAQASLRRMRSRYLKNDATSWSVPKCTSVA